MRFGTHARTALLALGTTLLLARAAGAQALGDPCLGPATAPQEVPTGAPFAMTWTMAQSVPKSGTDQTMVPHSRAARRYRHAKLAPGLPQRDAARRR